MNFLDCKSCLTHRDESRRRGMGCGWLAPTEPRERLDVWRGPQNSLGDIEDVTTCPAYTAALPDVVDVARLYSWADKGGLQRHTLTRPVIDGIDILRASVGEMEAFKIEEQRKREANRGAG